MAAYLLAEAKVGDPGAYAAYAALAAVAVSRYCGRYLACAGETVVLEGAWQKPEQLAIIEFDSVEQAQTFYNSPEYRDAREARRDAASINMLVIQGLPLKSD